jgi:hypothetical protein
MDEAFTWGLLVLLGIWGTILIKYSLDERKAKRRMLAKALYLRGKIAGLRAPEESNAAKTIQAFNDGLGRLKGDLGYLSGMIGYLEQYLQHVEEMTTEHKALTKEIGEWRKYYLDLMQLIIEAGETPPEPPERLKADFDTYNAMMQRARDTQAGGVKS